MRAVPFYVRHLRRHHGTSMKYLDSARCSGSYTRTVINYDYSAFPSVLRFSSSSGGSTYGSSDRHPPSKIPPNSVCPFVELGVPISSSYSEVKQAFVRLALKYHPDTAAPKTASTTEMFSRVRRAFESIRPNGDGSSVVISPDRNQQQSTNWSDGDLTAWFLQQTGRRLSFHMDETTRQEVVAVSKSMSPGGLDRGGMWEMAATLERMGNIGGQSSQSKNESPLQMPQGDTKRRKRR